MIGTGTGTGMLRRTRLTDTLRLMEPTAFDRDLTTELGVASPINFTHPARTDEREDLVVAESASGREWHNLPLGVREF